VRGVSEISHCEIENGPPSRVPSGPFTYRSPANNLFLKRSLGDIQSEVDALRRVDLILTR